MTAKFLFTISEAAERLSLSRSTLYELIGAGELRVVRVGRAVRVSAEELERWVRRRAALDTPDGPASTEGVR